MPRSYPPQLQARQSQLIRNHVDQIWDRFHRMWTAFNALYNAAGAPSERAKVRAIVQRFVTERRGRELLSKLLPPKRHLPDPPPGDTRYAKTDPRFRRASGRELAMVRNEAAGASDRLAALMVLVYQVRCSLVHGNKNPERQRDNELVKWGVDTLELVVPALEEVMSGRQT